MASPNATFGEKMTTLVSLGGVLLATSLSAATYPFSSNTSVQPTFDRELTRIFFRQLLDRTNPAQLQWVQPSSTQAYTDWIKGEGPKQDAPSEICTEVIGDEGAKLHWIGNKDAKKVLLHFHGGGFVMALHHGHMSLVNYFRLEVKRRSGVEVKCGFLEYILAPGMKYPGQFRQAVLAVKHILNSGISPADFIFTGDSAGGMLCTQILSHILHPHPEIPIIPIPSVPFAGIIPMSAWLIFDSEADSFLHNTRDMVSIKPLVAWGNLIREGTALAGNKDEPGGYWIEARKAPVEWWKGLQKVTHHVLLTYGEWEVFRDDIIELGNRLQAATKNTEVEVKLLGDPTGLHIDPTMDAYYGRAPKEITKIMAGWIFERLAT